jgi:hypothetical protein
VNLGGTSTVRNSTVSGTALIPDAPKSDEGGLINEPLDVTDAVAPSAQERAAVGRALSKKIAGNEANIKRAARKLAAAPAQPDGTLSVSGSIVADQTGGLTDCIGTITDDGYNLSSDNANSCKFSAAKHDLTKTDPKLGPLTDNGGPTETEILKKASPAIDAIPSGKAGCVADAADQRRIDRPQPTGGACDTGAVELEAKAIVIHPDSLPHGTVGEKYHTMLTATGGAYPTYTFSLAHGSLPDGLSLDSTGHITGTPTKAGTFKFTVSVNDPVLKDYTIVIEDAATNGAGNEPIAATGAPVVSMTAVGAGTVLAGFLLLMWAGLLGKRPGRHRSRS